MLDTIQDTPAWLTQIFIIDQLYCEDLTLKGDILCLLISNNRSGVTVSILLRCISPENLVFKLQFEIGKRSFLCFTKIYFSISSCVNIQSKLGKLKQGSQGEVKVKSMDEQVIFGEDGDTVVTQYYVNQAEVK